MTNLDLIKGSTKSYPGVKFLSGLYTPEYLQSVWESTLELIENADGDEFFLFKNGVEPFIFDLKPGVNKENVGERYEAFIQKHLAELKEFLHCNFGDEFVSEMSNYPFFSNSKTRANETGITQERAEMIENFYKKIFFSKIKKSIQGLRNWVFTVEDINDSKSTILAIAKQFDVKITKENIEAFDRIVKNDLRPKGLELASIASGVDELYRDHSDDLEAFSKKMEFFLSALYARRGLEKSDTERLLVPDPLYEVLIYPTSSGRSLILLKRAFPEFYEKFKADIEKIQNCESGPFFDPFKMGQEFLEELCRVKKEGKFMSPQELDEISYELIQNAKVFSARAYEEQQKKEMLKRHLPFRDLRSDEDHVNDAKIEDFKTFFDTKNINVVDLDQILKYFDLKFRYPETKEFMKKYGNDGFLKVHKELLTHVPFARNSLNGIYYLISTKLCDKPANELNSITKTHLKEYMTLDPECYSFFQFYMIFGGVNQLFLPAFIHAINDEEIFAGLIKGAKKLNNVGSAFAIRLLGMWAKGDEKKIAKVVENLFATDEDYKDADQTLRMKLFLFVTESGANIDFVMRRLLCGSETNNKKFVANHASGKEDVIGKNNIFDAFDEELVSTAYKELFDSPKQLKEIKGFKKPADFDKEKSLKEIELEASIALAEPIYVDMSDCLPRGFQVKLFPVEKSSADDFSWGVEISYRDFKNRPVYEKTTARFENLKFKFGFQGEFREIFEEISLLASHRYFVRDCAEANAKRIRDKIEATIKDRKDKNQEEDVKAKGVRKTSGTISVDISTKDKEADEKAKNVLAEKNVKSNHLIRKVIDGEQISSDEVNNLLVFSCENLGAGKNIYRRIPVEELIEWNEFGGLADFLLGDDCFVMTTLSHSQGAGYYVKGFEDENGGVLYRTLAKKQTDYSNRAQEAYLSSGFNPFPMEPYCKSIFGITTDGDAKIDDVKMRIKGSNEELLRGMAVEKSLNRKIAERSSDPAFIQKWVQEQIRLFKIENPEAERKVLEEFTKTQADILARNKVIDADTVKLFLGGEFETERVFNQGVYKKLSEVFVKTNPLDGEQ